MSEERADVINSEVLEQSPSSDAKDADIGEESKANTPEDNSKTEGNSEIMSGESAEPPISDTKDKDAREESKADTPEDNSKTESNSGIMSGESAEPPIYDTKDKDAREVSKEDTPEDISKTESNSKTTSEGDEENIAIDNNDEMETDDGSGIKIDSEQASKEIEQKPAEDMPENIGSALSEQNVTATSTTNQGNRKETDLNPPIEKDTKQLLHSQVVHPHNDADHKDAEPSKTDSKEISSKQTEYKKQTAEVEANFWLENSYKKVVRRIEDGAKSLDDLVKMVHERAEIESLYASKLKAWQKKWMDLSTKSFEYGSIYDALRDSYKEGESLSNLHSSVYGRLEELSRDVQQWKTETFPKAMTKFKEVKRSEEAYLKAQKPWTVKYNEVNRCMKAYHSSNSLRNLAQSQELELKKNKATPQEQLNKVAAKFKKAEQDIEITKGKYEEALRDIGNYNPKYQEDMKHEFAKCQKFEETRRKFVKEKLCLFQACVDRNMFIENYKRIYALMSSIFDSINIEEDLKWYKENYGIDHPFVILKYIEYDPKLHSALEKTSPSSPSKKGVVSSPSSKKGNSGVCAAL